MDTIGYRQYINRELPWQDRACTSKAVFVSRREALSLAHHGRRASAGTLHPYRCRFCDGWHLGHRRHR